MVKIINIFKISKVSPKLHDSSEKDIGTARAKVPIIKLVSILYVEAKFHIFLDA
jgi:hypothetical protein